jgi:peptidyl-prolyl cis-trans isomerase SDCCAG10
MSSVYATEPPTSGRVILETTHGPLEIYLWCRECPQTTRFFLQLCLDGYYDTMIFHRIVGNFLIQTGALRHQSQQSQHVSLSHPNAMAYRQAIRAKEALDRRSYEINSRIQFNHRGQVAMALSVEDSDTTGVEELQPQFFVLLEDASYLNSKHVIFGTISGPTIFNALRIARTETDDETHQPVDIDSATRILSVKIVDNPIHTDLVPQPHTIVPWRQQQSQLQSQGNNNKEQQQGTLTKKKKRKGKLDTNVLSFGAEFLDDDPQDQDQDQEQRRTKSKKGMQSCHDVLVDSKILGNHVDEQVKKQVFMSDDNNNTTNNNSDNVERTETSTTGGDDDNNKEWKRPKLEQDKAAVASMPEDSSKMIVHPKEKEPTTTSVTFSSRKERQQATTTTSSSSLAAGALEREEGKRGTHERNKDKETTKLPKVSLVEARRLKYSKGKKSKKEREDETLAKLISFRTTVQQKVEEQKTFHKNDDDDDDDEPQDNSLASRMARKDQKVADAKKKQQQGNNKTGQHLPTYHGQLLDTSDHDDNDDNKTGHSKKNSHQWLGTTFKCQKHMDHDAHLGGDGRDADDYKVIDPKAKQRGAGDDKKHNTKSHSSHQHRGDNQKRHDHHNKGKKQERW